MIGKQHKSAFVKLYISFIVFFAVPVIALMTFFGTAMVRSSQSEVMETNLARLTTVRDSTDHLLQNVQRISLDISINPILNDFYEIGTSLYGNRADHVFVVLNLLKILSNARSLENRIESIYLYNEHANMVLTSENEIRPRARFKDAAWLDELEKVDTMPLWLEPRLPNDQDEEDPPIPDYLLGLYKSHVLTQVRPLSPFRTTLPGAIAINIGMDDFNKLLGISGLSDESEFYVVSRTGEIIIHNFQDRQYRDQSSLGSFDLLRLEEIRESKADHGFLSPGKSHDNHIIFFARSNTTDWLYIERTEYRRFLSSVRALIFVVIGISLLMLIGGFGVAYLAARWLYNPVAKLVDDIQRQSGINLAEAYADTGVLSQAVMTLKKQESSLVRLQERRKKEIRDHALMLLVQGDDIRESDRDYYFDFPHSRFFCAIASIDNFAGFESQFDPEQRHYVKELIFKISEEIMKNRWIYYSVQYQNDKMVFLFNIADRNMENQYGEITSQLREIQEETLRSLQLELSFSTGNTVESSDAIEDSFIQAQNGLKLRLVKGRRCFILPTDQIGGFTVARPAEIGVNHVFNTLRLGTENKVIKELDLLFSDITNRYNYYGTIQIIHLLLSNTITYLLQEHIDPSAIFGNDRHPYDQVSSLETIGEVKEYFKLIFARVIAQKDISPLVGNRRIVRIVDYIEQNYQKDISAEDVAASAGMGYHHMRRVFKEQLGVSFLDYINMKRIGKAKELLRSTDDQMPAIAEIVGYNNTQSFTRYFKKYEGITPGEYRGLK